MPPHPRRRSARPAPMPPSRAEDLHFLPAPRHSLSFAGRLASCTTTARLLVARPTLTHLGCAPCRLACAHAHVCLSTADDANPSAVERAHARDADRDADVVSSLEASFQMHTRCAVLLYFSPSHMLKFRLALMRESCLPTRPLTRRRRRRRGRHLHLSFRRQQGAALKDDADALHATLPLAGGADGKDMLAMARAPGRVPRGRLPASREDVRSPQGLLVHTRRSRLDRRRAVLHPRAVLRLARRPPSAGRPTSTRFVCPSRCFAMYVCAFG
jgi:hypothetical protein